MFESNASKAKTELKNLLRDVQTLFNEASTASGDKADELRNKGMSLLNSATRKAHDVQVAAVETGKEVAQSANDLVQSNPWKSVAISGGVGLLVGMLIARR